MATIKKKEYISLLKKTPTYKVSKTIIDLENNYGSN